ncbi:unnamed protein product [Brassicogethes aeneus]|uniref:CAF1B/HIR1 beta-propeller domain-containing protein n=1 Tax=Brassicogethes aeneus TaxID=1431903 RepID=A0A9P0FG33_BRAAE|nr:unnamed protein product [Brassicogethes aeneus]
MKCTIPEISWHNREPVLSVDIHPISTDFYRLATGGGDCHVLIWQLNLTEEGAVKVENISDLTRHQRAVNAVRWSPTGQYLVSADDDANIIIWQLKTDNIPLLEGDTNDKETWITHKILRGHKEDIYDICWSVDGLKLLSGSVDNTAILWDVTKGKMEHILSDHKGFVQGVAWDPKNQFIATISTDRICRIFDTTGKQVKARILKGKLPVSNEHYLHNKEVKYFHDDTFKSFYRRLQFSPDGSILICPSGHVEADDCKKILSGTMIFTMDNWNSPAAILPLKKQCSTVIRCSPVLFELHEKGPEPYIKLPYRIIIAVATDHDVILYDTQQHAPFAWLQQIHYTRLTDLSWSPDGQLLTACSTDGFCALITFEHGELGTPYTEKECIEENTLNVSGVEELEEDENVDISNKDKPVENTEKEADKCKKNSFLLQWAKQPKTSTNKEPTINRLVPKEINVKNDTQNNIQEIDLTSEEVTKKEDKPEVNILIPRKSKKPEENIKVNVLMPRKAKKSEVNSKVNILVPRKKEEPPKVNILIPRRKAITEESVENPKEETTAQKEETNVNVLTPKKIQKPNEIIAHSPSSRNKINVLTPRKTKRTNSDTSIGTPKKDFYIPKTNETPKKVVIDKVEINESTPDGKEVQIKESTPKKIKPNNSLDKSKVNLSKIEEISDSPRKTLMTKIQDKEETPRSEEKNKDPKLNITTKRITPLKKTESGQKNKIKKTPKSNGSSLLQKWVKSPSIKKKEETKEKEVDSDVEIVSEEKISVEAKKVLLSKRKSKNEENNKIKKVKT